MSKLTIVINIDSRYFIFILFYFNIIFFIILFVSGIWQAVTAAKETPVDSERKIIRINKTRKHKVEKI